MNELLQPGFNNEDPDDQPLGKERLEELFSVPAPETEGMKKKIIVKKGNAYVVLNLRSVAVFYFEKVSFAVDFSGNKYMLKENLTMLEEMLDPYRFFRVNRETILNVDAVKEFTSSRTGRITIQLVPLEWEKKEISVSQFSAAQFRKWIYNL
ncbi:MAG TPA: LytTR family transcriptional regulator DNA-binding domain-containing protein [Flavisolibacter sp.]|nr:LytTR family transcriptional regulator DNA-binding domain-containing protein [Flavisolibacter sp.]